MLEKLELRNSVKKSFSFPVKFLIKKIGYRVLLSLILLNSCKESNLEADNLSNNIPESKDDIGFFEKKTNPFDKYFVGEIANVKVFKDTLFLSYNEYKDTYFYSKYSNDLEVSESLEKLEKVIYLFPPKFRQIFHKKLDTIFMVKKMVKNGKELDGLYEDYVFLSDMKAFAHEVSHVIDDVLDKDDFEWAISFYGNNYREYYKKNNYGRPLGFSSAYAQRSVKEDKAETLYDLIVLHEWKMHPKDRVLQAKIKKMKEELFQIDNSFNEQYWKDLEAGKINKQYWENK